MTPPDIRPVAPGEAGAALLALNNAHAAETSHLEPAALRAMVAAAFRAAWVPDGDGAAALLIAFAPDAARESPNFRWFRFRYAGFVYVDRVIVAAPHRGRGIARALYADLFDRARAAGYARIAAEVNAEPANPGSDAFHAAMGFRRVGTGVPAPGKRVSYLVRPLGA